MKTPILLIGVGNRYRRDDGAGLVMVESLSKEFLSGVEWVETGGEGSALMNLWKGYDIVFLFDAVSSNASSGTVYHIEASAQPIPTKFFHYSTHAFGVAEAVELARLLGELPGRFVLYGIEGKDFGEGEGLSEEVGGAVRSLLPRIVCEVKTIAKDYFENADCVPEDKVKKGARRA